MFHHYCSYIISCHNYANNIYPAGRFSEEINWRYAWYNSRSGCIRSYSTCFRTFGHVTGYNVDDIENLIYVGQNSKLDIGGMLFSGILIASLGAVMDVAMSVSSSLHEIKENRPDISAKEIFHAGINIGRDMIGTMSNTLILAYAGGSLGLVMIIYAYSYQMHQILNMYSVAIEIMRGISGTMGIILTVPITSLIMSVLLTQKGKK